MNQIEAAQKEIELATLLNTKYPDIQAHVDLIAGSDEIIISLSSTIFAFSLIKG